MPRSEDRPILLCSAGVEAGGPGVGATGGGQPGLRPPQHGFLVVLVILHKNHRVSCADCACDSRVSLESQRICFNLYVADAATLLGTQWIVAMLAGLCEYYAVRSPEGAQSCGCGRWSWAPQGCRLLWTQELGSLHSAAHPGLGGPCAPGPRCCSPKQVLPHWTPHSSVSARPAGAPWQEAWSPGDDGRTPWPVLLRGALGS